MATQVELLMLGNELLIGQMQDTNSHWLIQKITYSGGEVRRVTLIPDDESTAIEEVKAALHRKADLLITVGGLGPTYDDQTLRALSLALNRPCTLHPKAKEMLETFCLRKSRESDGKTQYELTPSRLKMAYLPEGAIPLWNHVGAAPGSLIHEQGTYILSLPGVPLEMKDIFENSFEIHREKIFQTTFYHEVLLEAGNVYEAEIAPEIAAIAERWKQVYIKSNPRYLPEGVRMILIVAGRGVKREIEALIEKVVEDIQATFSKRGMKVQLFQE